VLLNADVVETGLPALSHEGLGLSGRPPMAGEAGGAGTHLPLDREESPTWGKYPAGFGEPRSDVLPVVDGGQRPHNRRGPVRLRQLFGGAFSPADGGSVSSQSPGQPEHHGCGIDPGYACSTAGGFSGGGAGATADVDNVVRMRHQGQISGKSGDATPPDHGETSEQASHAREAGMAGVMVDRVG
jgi:hypothetical protein